MEESLKECSRCGKCCENGGPALHSEDLPRVMQGSIPLERLITIRRGEYVHHPVSRTVQPAKQELVKLKGQQGAWTCYYYESGSGCTIYENRPLACRTLECWNPEEAITLMENDTLTRLDLLQKGHPLREVIESYERNFPCPDFEKITARLSMVDGKERSDLELLVNNEIAYRSKLVAEHELSLALELFCFGRPLFQQLQSLGIKVVEEQGKLRLQWPV